MNFVLLHLNKKNWQLTHVVFYTTFGVIMSWCVCVFYLPASDCSGYLWRHPSVILIKLTYMSFKQLNHNFPRLATNMKMVCSEYSFDPFLWFFHVLDPSSADYLLLQFFFFIKRICHARHYFNTRLRANLSDAPSYPCCNFSYCL